MRFTVVAVGKLKERFWADACAEYLKRLQPYARTSVKEVADVDPGRAGGVAPAREREGAAILAALPASAHVVLLAIEGVERSSTGPVSYTHLDVYKRQVPRWARRCQFPPRHLRKAW